MAHVMTIEEVAAYLRVSRFTIYRLAKARVLPGSRVGRQWRFQQEEIDRWIANQSQPRRRRRR